MAAVTAVAFLPLDRSEPAEDPSPGAASSGLPLGTGVRRGLGVSHVHHTARSGLGGVPWEPGLWTADGGPWCSEVGLQVWPRTFPSGAVLL